MLTTLQLLKHKSLIHCVRKVLFNQGGWIETMIHNLWYVEADKSYQCISKDNNTFCGYTKENNSCSSLPSLDPGQIQW